VGNHKVVSAKLRAGDTNKRARKSTVIHFPSSRALTLQNWPVSWRLIAVIVVALVMGLVFGGLRVAAAANSAAGFGRVSQLANLGQQVTGLVQALEDERDETTGAIPAASPKAAAAALQRWYNATDAAAAKVQVLAAGIGGSFPANIRAKVATVLSVISHRGELRSTAQASQSALAVIADYSAPIGDMLSLNGQIAQGTADSGLANGVQALNSLSLAKDEAAQQRAILFNALTQQLFADGELQALTTAESVQAANLTAFDTTATPGEQSSFRNTVAGPLVNRAELIEEYVISVGSLDTSALDISPGAAPRQWYSAMSDTVDKMQNAERGVARSIVARSQMLQRGAEQSALFTAVLTAVILLLVLIATLVVARSLVRPLRRLQAGALDIATVQLPERVRQLGEVLDPATSLEVTPIDVPSADEIGQVARAFDQVHSEAVRLAGNEAMLRSSFNALFVNLSRRSQSLIERLARMIDSLEQNEEDPGRLSNLFAMDHMVTRMRRNSENLLLLAGHESARKWSEPVPLADVAGAAISEIEQYSRVALNIQPGIAVSGQTVSDVVRLLAEIIENATMFSPKDTQVRVSAQELSGGGVLIEVSDSGVGVSDARLAEINQRLDNPPVIDPSVGRHMGLFAVAHLAERHKMRVRLRAGSPRGLTALVWLPDSLIERGTRQYGDGRWSQPLDAQAGFQAGRTTGGHSTVMRSATDGPSTNDRPDAVTMPMHNSAGTRETVQAAGSATPNWFRSRRPSATPAAPAAGNGGRPPAAAPQPGGGGPSGTDGWAQGRHAAQIIADPVRGARTVAGLPVRIPQANLIPGSVGGRQAGSRVTSRPADSHEAQQTPAAPLPQRSPEMARSRLSGFQRGARRAEGQRPRTGEGADR
jgi:signal transduction histidine kinase